MSTTLGRMQVDLEARIAKFESDMGRAARILQRDMVNAARANERAIKQMRMSAERDAAKMRNSISSTAKALGAFFSINMAARFIGDMGRAADAFANVGAKVRLAAGENANLARSFDEVYGVAQRTYNTLDGTASLVQRGAQALRSYGLSNRDAFEESIKLAEIFNKSLVVSGASTEEAAASALQFSQALASGRFQGDEFRSVMENNSVFAKLLADSLGVNVAELRNLSKEGKLTTQSFLELKDHTAELDAQFARMPLTIGRAKTQLDNAFTKFIGEADQANSSSQGVAKSISNLAKTLEDPGLRAGFSSMLSGLAKLTEYSIRAIASVGGLAGAISDAFAKNAQKSYDGLLVREDEVQGRLKLLREGQQHMGVGRMLDTLSMVGIGPGIADLEAELKQLKALEARFRQRPAPEVQTFDLNGQETIHGGAGLADPDKAASAAAKAAAAALREQAAAKRVAAAAAADLQQANDQLTSTFDAQARELGGPMVAAALEYRDTLVAIQKVEDEFRKQGKLDDDAKAKLALARSQADAGYQKQLASIRAIKSPLEQVIEAQKKELAVIGLTGTALEVETLRLNSTAEEWKKYGQTVQANAEAIAAGSKAHEKEMAAMDEFRQNVADTTASILDRSQTIGEAFKSMADSILAQMARIAAQRFTDWLLGPQGSSSGGAGGGGIMPFFMSLLGGGRAAGGPVRSGAFYEVGEGNSPELFRSGHRTYLIPGNAGEVTPMRGGGGDFHQTLVFNVAGRVDSRTRDQSAASQAREARRAMSRNGS
jgi:tape measure domain-containing protein